MRTFHPSRVFTAVVVSLSLLCTLSACATSSGGVSDGGASDGGSSTGDLPEAVASAPAPQGVVVGQGTVLDDGTGPELCLGGVAESYPPQCSGVPLVGWSWDGLLGVESASGVTWGAFAVQGTFDGSALTMTGTPIMLALYDPVAAADPTEGRAGTSDGATLEAVRAKIAYSGVEFLSAGAEGGYLWLDVVWDDGTIQAAMDADYGEGVVLVRSALREIGG